MTSCYSLGNIEGEESGGITGNYAGSQDGTVHITNSYSRGNIDAGDFAGGVCGFSTGDNGGTVIINNVCASGNIQHADAGG